MIRVEGLTVRFGDREVLNGIDLDFPRGQTTAIMGASGGGKTTLLRCIAGLIPATEGRVFFDGTDVTRLPERKLLPFRRRTGFVFQYAALFDYLTVGENVAFGAQRLGHIPRSRIPDLVKEKLALVGMQDTEHLYPSQLSGGMRKRVGLARAIATEPEVLFYDEPTSGLDPVMAYTIDTLIRDLKTRLGVTSVVVSHDVNSVFRVADRVAVLAKGRIVEMGDPATIRASRQPDVVELLSAYGASSLE